MSDRRRTLRLAPETFSREYVEALRKEVKHFRLKAQAAEAARDRIQLEADARIIKVELASLARAAGMYDPDDLRLADTSTVTIGADGQVTGAAELLAALRRAKPFLFR